MHVKIGILIKKGFSKKNTPEKMLEIAFPNRTSMLSGRM